MSKKAKLLTALIIGSMITIGGVSTVHNTTTNHTTTNINLLAAPTNNVNFSTPKAFSGLLNQSLSFKTTSGSVIKNAPVTISANGKTVFTGTVINGQANLNSYYNFGELSEGLNYNGSKTFTIAVKGYNTVTESINVKKMYSMVAMQAVDANMSIDAKINGADQNFKSSNNGSLFIYSDNNFTFAPANMNDKFGKQYNQANWQFNVTPFYVIENKEITLSKNEPKAYDGLMNQSLTFKSADGSLIKNSPVTISAGGKTLFTGTTTKGVVDLNNYYTFGKLIDGLNYIGTNTFTIKVDGFKPVTEKINVKKMYSMVEMHALNNNTNVDATVNGVKRNFKPVRNGSLFLFSDSNFTFAPTNMNDSFGRQYQEESWQYNVSPFYVITNQPITLEATQPKAYDNEMNQSLTFKNKKGDLIDKAPVTISQNGKTLFTGITTKGVVDLNNYFYFGQLTDGLNYIGDKTFTIKVGNYAPITETINVKKMYSMVETHALNKNTNVDATVNGIKRNFKTVRNGSLFIFSDHNFTFAPTNMNDSFGRQYQEESWQYNVTPFYVITNNAITL